MRPLAPELYEFRFTGDQQAHDDLRCLQELLRHQIPNGDAGRIIRKALHAYRNEIEKKRLAATDHSRPERGIKPGSRTIPAAVKRAVLKRDGRRCAFVSSKGFRCTATGFLQFHHADPHGDGGLPSVQNVEMRCRTHNLYEAELYYGLRGIPLR